MKYRGKEINFGQLVYGESACEDENGNVYIFKLKNDDKLSASVYQVYQTSLTTKSNLFAKNGRQLYYGDIIAFNNYESNKIEYYILTAYFEEYIIEMDGHCDFIGTVEDNPGIFKMFDPVSFELKTVVDKNK